MILKGEATVIKSSGNLFMLSALPEWKPFPAVLKGKIRLKGNTSTNPVAIGDRVTYECDTEMPTFENPASITEVLERKNHLIRKSTNLSKQSHVIASNIDMAYIIVSLYFPEVKLAFLDRILVTCEVYGIPATIILNKVDIYGSEVSCEIENFKNIYEGVGYKVIETSVKTGEGIEELRKLCENKINLFSGESGVGKSSLIKALDPSLDPKTGKISTTHLQGKHTTSLYEMYKITSENGGCIIDTPGIRGFGLVDLQKEEIALYFPEMLRLSKDCRFTPCTHTHEPGCAVKSGLDEGFISQERYNSYLGMLEEDKKFR
ncbi:MAG: ribosome small subunit-dependent GTPase A [Candidatus Cryptobacteroides sp.]